MLGTGDARIFLSRRGKNPAPVYPRDLSVDPKSSRDRDRLLAGDETATEYALDWLAPAPWLVPAPLLAALPPSLSHGYHGAIGVS